ncbi:hypothetical protein K402DRAFT_405534 [Aulographum hederae CBS 113979]|uniref:Cell morphogenesis protein-like protein n=1 Tax=Aulographum hederae CBS 113979 TaxID=1176131 RepID=A0A6G1GVT3_9PEZI|nr:hypothetical protein K402DRAFT_405534 [Aulographum hederae CBS 113979]
MCEYRRVSHFSSCCCFYRTRSGGLAAAWSRRSTPQASSVLPVLCRLRTRQHAGSLSHHADIPAIAPAPPTAPSREASVNRGRALTASSGRGSSSRSQTPAVSVPKLATSTHDLPPGTGLDRKPSLSSYGHHRNTSIVHGIQHSRNTSFVNSPSNSPLSPQIIAAAGNTGQHVVDGYIMAQEDGRSLSAGLPSSAGTANGSFKNVTSPPGSAVSSVLNGSSLNESMQNTNQRRPERMLSNRSKKERGHEHQRSHSRMHHHHQQELKTVGEYALHHLFNAFVGQADQKIAQCTADPAGPEPRVETICGHGVDPAFDQLIVALGHIARQKPKPLIDTLMFWRKAKSEAAQSARQDLGQYSNRTPASINGLLARRNGEPLPIGADSDHSTLTLNGPSSAIMALQLAVTQAERGSSVSIYLLCRVFMEIIGQSNIECVTPELAKRLEEIIYDQLRSANPEYLDDSSLRQANWVIFGQLLGVMSNINFESVTDRFIGDLEMNLVHSGVKGPTGKEIEGRAVLTIRGMSYIRLKTYPEPAWDHSCEFMQQLAKLMVKAHGQPVKYAYCQLLKELLLPVAATATSELNMPKWRVVIETLRPKLLELLAKPKHWQSAFPVLALVLCTSPSESFSVQWMQLIPPLQARLKERGTRGVALRGICRLVWTYLYRTSDSHNVTVKKLDEIIKIVFQPGKKSYLSTESFIAEPMIQLIRIIGFKYQDLCFRTIIFPLMNSELFSSGKDYRVEHLEPERMVIGIRAFLAIMTDLEKGEPPPFPVNFDSDPSMEPFDLVSLPISPRPFMGNTARNTTVKEERLSRPVMITGFGEVAREYYVRFCKILGEITIICDNTFGGQAVLDEKFGSQTPKTPMTDAFSFARRDDHQNPSDPRQGFYDLLHVAVQALPRCLSPHIQFNSLINLLCTGTAHVQNNIAASSAQSLKSIARQQHAQQVTIGFARFIFNFDDRYATMSDGGMLGPGHIESTLKLYVELLHIWIEEIKQKTKKPAADSSDNTSRGAGLDLSGIWAHVDEVESHGLFFLCSPSRRVRAFAVTVLRLVTEFDTALGKDNSRIIRVLEGSPQKIMDINDQKLSLAERSRLQRGMRKSNLQSTLVELCGSDTQYESTLWFKIFPNLVRISFEICPFAVTLTRDIVTARLSQMRKPLSALAEGSRSNPYSAFDAAPNRVVGRLATTAPEVVIEQWKLYLIFACTTLMNTGGHQQMPSQGPQHIRKTSKSSQGASDKIQTAGDLFAKVIPFLSVTNQAIRDAAVVGLGSVNVNLYRTLLESLQHAVVACNDEAKSRLASHQRTVSSPRRTRRTDFLRTEITHVYKLTSYFLQLPEVVKDEWILNTIINYTKELRLFLNDAEVQHEWEYQKLRIHYCGLIEQLFEGLSKTKEPMRWMSFQSRKATFALMEEWCGYSPNQNQIRQRENSMKQSILDREQDYGGQRIATAAMEIEKRDLRTAALGAMATLCAGPVSITTDSKVMMQFDIARMLSWIDAIFDAPSDRTHAIGRRALKNLVIHNKQHVYLLDRAIEKCYIATSPKALESFFEVVTQVLTEREDFAPPFWKVLSAGLHTLGNESNDLRTKSARLLRLLEERQQKSSKLQDLDISISDKTIAVYKLAQFEISRRLATQHPELAFLVFSEFSKFFKDLQPDHQRNMVAAMLPWIQTIELQLDPNGGPTASSYMLLVNLFEMTIRCGTALHNEIMALWQALATGPYAGNVRLVLDFIINLCLEKREQNFVDYAKQIVVYLSSTLAGAKVIEFLLMQICPKAMVLDSKREPFPIPPEATQLPYLADLGVVLPAGKSQATTQNKQAGFSLGQLCLILLVDLMVSPVQLDAEHVPLLLQVVLVLWDHYTPLVQDQAREMLVHLIHELIISRIDKQTVSLEKRSIEDFIESIRQHDSKVVWTYEDFSGKVEVDAAGIRVPEAMSYLTTEVVRMFSVFYPTLREDWGRVSLHWATTCSVRHLACRSFQIFRSNLSSLDQPMLADILIRLSNTIADQENPDVEEFSVETLTTLKTIIEALEPTDLIQYPQLFWTTCACLETTHEQEFTESLAMLEKLLDKLDLADPAIIARLSENFPEKWSSTFEGLQSLIYKGVRSSNCLERSLKVLERLVVLPSSDLVGDETRLVFTVLANFPGYLHHFDQEVKDSSVTASAEVLATVAEDQECDNIARALRGFSQGRYRSQKDFLSQAVSAIRESFFPVLEYKSLVFLMSLLTNKIPWFKMKTMQLLCVVVPDIDMRQQEVSTKGPDLISPLLRLLQTEYCPQALEVLDNVMTMTGTPMDKHHLRMSMAGSHSTRAFRKEYERTQSLYGIPEESGWSIPMPAVHSHTTRENIHAVFYTCANAEVMENIQAATPDIQLVAEDYQKSSYFPEYRSATMMSDDTRGEAQLGEAVMKLDDLDDFFEDYGEEPGSAIATASNDGAHFQNNTIGGRENLYDQQTFPILHKSLTRNASISSFQTGFADNKNRDVSIMTPTAFTMPGQPQNLTLRPGLHSRSITSPAVNQRTPPGTGINIELPFDETEEMFSDDDFAVGSLKPNDASGEKSFSLESMIKPIAQGTRSGFRSGIRRLTGGGGDTKDGQKAREAIRAQLQRSPQVPKVPDVYLLQNPKSADP